MVRRLFVTLLASIFFVSGVAGSAQAAGTVHGTVAFAQLQPNRVEEPPPSCWQNFHMTRTGTDVRIVAEEMYMYLGNDEYGLIWVSDEYGTHYSAYNVSPYGGANFVIDTGRTGKQNISVSVTNAENTRTLCDATIYV